MVTASHNPKDDNGYKVYWENGPQIIPPHDEGIANMILDNVKPWAVPRLDESFDGCELVDDRIGDMYMASIASLCRFRTENPNRSLRIAYTPVHGVGAKFARRAFEVFGLKPFTETKEQIMPDPEFSTVTFPNPEEGATTMQLVVQTARANDCRLVLANDPDADRLAVAEVQDDGSVYFFNGNEIALLFADYVWQYGRDKTIAAKDSFMVASTVSSKILRRMGEVEGFAFHDTLTGFKYMGNKSQELVAQGKQFLFAFEVEIGFLVGDMSFDKDGVRTAACMAEFASMLDAQGERLLTHLRRLYDKYGYFYMIPSYYFCYDPQIMAKVCDACRYPQYIQSIGGDPVVWIRDLTVGYQSDTEGHKPTLPVSSASQFLQMRLQSGVDITIRNSGTEPKLKYYVEANGPTLDDAKRKAQVAEKALIEEVLQPAKYGLQPRK
jgi:phosphoglucomutase